MKVYSKKILKTAFITLLLCFAAACFLFSGFYGYAKADGENYTRVLPETPLETTELISPTHVYSDDEITAITTSDNKLLISYADNAPTEISFSSELGQVLRFKNYLLYRVEHNMYAINLDDTDQRISLKYTIGADEQNLACDNSSAFDNGEYLSVAVCVEEKLKIYTIEEGDAAPAVSLLPYFSANIIPIKKAPVAINRTSVFYIAQNGVLCKRDINSLGGEPTQYKVINPSAMIADDLFVYCIYENDIYRFTVADETAEPVILSITDCEYQLGIPTLPADITFKNGNLLITDNAGSVQEFKVNGDALEFTGYAIASGLTAYNRISANATDIERYGQFVAALDGDKLTVIDTENCANYDKNGFINKFVGSAPDCFALGNGTILYANGVSVYIANIAQDGADNNKQITGLPTEIAPNDITYQSGIYYLIYTGIGTNTNIYKIAEKTGEKTGEENVFTGVDAKRIAVDVFGNIYLADLTQVYKNEIDNAYPLAGATKLATDLAGNLFALANGTIYKLDQAESEFIQAFSAALGNIKSFGLNFDKNQVFFLIEGQEQVYKTTALGNSSLQDVMPDAAFTAATQSVRELKVYAAKDGANVYSVSATETAFTFNGLSDLVAAAYPFMSEFVLSDSLTLYALASEKGVVLINKKDATDITGEISATEYAAPEKTYITTAVNAYAIPVVEENDAFAINTESGAIRLDKWTEIYAAKEFDILGKTFYLATATVKGETVDCYIPKSFTVKTLSADLDLTEYRLETVKSTAIYLDENLTEKITDLNSGDTVRVLSEENGVLKVAARQGDTEYIGYISEKAIKTKPNTIVRNVLILLAVFGSLAGTLTYFLLRKKK